MLPDEQEALTEASKRSPRNEVARFILSDLDQAISLMNNNVKKTRLSKNAALLLKSRVALFEATWENIMLVRLLFPMAQVGPEREKIIMRAISSRVEA